MAAAIFYPNMRYTLLTSMLLLVFVAGGLNAQNTFSDENGRQTSGGRSLTSEIRQANIAGELYRAGDFENALRAYAELADRYPLSDDLSQYYFYVAICWARSAQDADDLYRALSYLNLSARRPPLYAEVSDLEYWRSWILERDQLEPIAATEGRGSRRALRQSQRLETRRRQAWQDLCRWLDAITPLDDSDSSQDDASDAERFQRGWELGYRLDSRYSGADAAASRLSHALDSRWRDGGQRYPLLERTLAAHLLDSGKYRQLSEFLLPRLSGENSQADSPLNFALAESLYFQNSPVARQWYETVLFSAEEGDGASALKAASALRLFDLYRSADDDGAALEDFVARSESIFADDPDIQLEFYQRLLLDSYIRGDVDAAQQYLAKLEEIPPSQRGFVAEFFRGIFEAKDDPQAALASIENFYLRGGKKSPWLELLRAEMLYRMGSLDAAHQLLSEQAGGTTEESAAGFERNLFQRQALLLAHIDYEQGRYQQALEQLRNVEAHEARPLRSASLARLGRFSQAADELQRYGQNQFLSEELQLQLLQYLLSAGEIGEVFREYETINQPSPAQDYVRSLAMLQSGDLSGGRDFLLATIRRLASSADSSADNPVLESSIAVDAQYYLGWSSYRLGDDQSAIAAYENFLEQGSASNLLAIAAYEAAWSALRLGQFDNALNFIRTMESLSSSGADSPVLDQALYLRGKVLRSSGDYDAAAAALLSFRRRFPRHELADDAFLDYARVLLDAGREDQAVTAFREFLQSYPASDLYDGAAFELAKAQFDAGRYAQARDAFSEYRSLGTSGGGEVTGQAGTSQSARQVNVQAALYFSALASRELGEDGPARLYLERLLSQSPRSGYAQAARYQMAQMLDAAGEYGRALEYYRSYASGSLTSQSAQQVNRRISELEQLLRGSSASEAPYWARIDADPGLTTDEARSALLELGRLVVIRQGGNSARLDQMIELLQRMAESERIGDAAGALYILARNDLQNGNYQSAAQRFLDSAATNPSDRQLGAESLYFACEAYAAAGQQANARAIAEQLGRSYPDSDWVQSAREIINQFGGSASQGGGS